MGVKIRLWLVYRLGKNFVEEFFFFRWNWNWLLSSW